MNGNSLFLDTNIILYLLSGDKTIANLVDGKQIYISFITQLELLGFKNINKKEVDIINKFLSDCIIIDINSTIKENVIELRRKYTLKLPDNIIIATAIYLGVPLISADMDFKGIDELDLLYYQK